MEPSTTWVDINPCPFAVFWLAVLFVSFTAAPPVPTGQNFRKNGGQNFRNPQASGLSRSEWQCIGRTGAGETVTWQPLSRSDGQTGDRAHVAGDQADRRQAPRTCRALSRVNPAAGRPSRVPAANGSMMRRLRHDPTRRHNARLRRGGGTHFCFVHGNARRLMEQAMSRRTAARGVAGAGGMPYVAGMASVRTVSPPVETSPGAESPTAADFPGCKPVRSCRGRSSTTARCASNTGTPLPRPPGSAIRSAPTMKAPRSA